MTERDIDKVFNEHRDRYLEVLKPLFLPDDPISNDIIRYFASLLRVLGMEDKGWDPYLESHNILNDLNHLINTSLPPEKFPSQEHTMWRLGLLLYSHIVEMSAPLEVLTNLLRFRLGDGYDPDPYYIYLTKDEKKKHKKYGIKTWKKLEIIKALSDRAGVGIGSLFDEFYNSRLRNAVQHSDFILTEDGLRSRSGISGKDAFFITYDDLDATITKAKAFIAAFFSAEMLARQVWGTHKQTAIPYDSQHKGIMEVLVDDRDVMCGFAIHWPNNSQSTYRRTESGITMTNCMVDSDQATISLMVDLYARQPGKFSPLVEHDAEPIYTPLDGTSVRPTWPV